MPPGFESWPACTPPRGFVPQMPGSRSRGPAAGRTRRLGESLRLLRVDPGGVDSTIDSGSDLLKALLRSSPLRVSHEHLTPTTLACSLTPPCALRASPGAEGNGAPRSTGASP